MKKKKLSKNKRRDVLRLIWRTTKFYRAEETKGWHIQFSNYADSFILLIVTSTYTAQTLVRYYDDEESAVSFLKWIMAIDPKHELEII